MNISFEGLRNITHSSTFDFHELNNPKFVSRIAFQVDNKGAVRDLSEFETVLKQFPDTSVKNNFFRLDAYTNLIHLSEGDKFRMREAILEDKPIEAINNIKQNGEYFKLNDKLLDLNDLDKDASVFSKILNVLKRIISGQEEFPIVEDYIGSDDFIKNINILDSITDAEKIENLSKTIEISGYKKAAVSGAKTLHNALNMAINRYFNIK